MYIETPNKPTDVLTKLSQKTEPYTSEAALGTIIIERKIECSYVWTRTHTNSNTCCTNFYVQIRTRFKEKGFPLYVPYNHIAQGRRTCYPS